MINQQVYAEAFAQLLHQLDPNNQSALVQAFADNIGATMTGVQTSRNVVPDYTGPLIELAHAANLDQSFVYAFQQVSTVDITARAPHNTILICSQSSHSHRVSLSRHLEALSLFKRVLCLPLVCGLLCRARLAHGVLQ